MASKLVVAENGKERSIEDIDLVEEAIKRKNKGDRWGVIALLLEAIVKRYPDEMKALQIQIADTREMLDDKEFGTTRGGQDFERRMTVIFPFKLQQMLRALYTVDELSMDSLFYREFVQRFPNFRIAEKN